MIKDSSAIKLFGKTITLPPSDDDDVLYQKQSSSDSSFSDDSKDESRADMAAMAIEEAVKNDEPVESNNSSEEKTACKPDKILPCPRCNSLKTKFCYYNNYNISQPRHFCKKCQRYWTAGGSMRNVPVGSGRRKNKQTSMPIYRHSLPSEGIHFPFQNPNYLVFGSDSMAAAARSQNPPSLLQISPSPFLPSCFPVTFYPTPPYWGTPLHNSWNFPFVHPPSPISKTLRIDDPEKAAKSSILSTIKDHKIDSLQGRSFFQPLVSKADLNDNISNSAMVLQANPAALSRALNFHETAKI